MVAFNMVRIIGQVDLRAMVNAAFKLYFFFLLSIAKKWRKLSFAFEWL
jgi:hypothetical protein